MFSNKTLPPVTTEKRHFQGALFLVAYVGAIFLSCAAGYYFYGDYSVKAAQKKAAETQHFQTDMAYIDLPRISVMLPNANHTGNVRMDITVEVEGKYAAQVEGFRPRIADRLLHYTQTLNYDDIARAKSTVWLRPDILEEVQKASEPMPIKDVIFRQLIVL